MRCHFLRTLWDDPSMNFHHNMTILMAVCLFYMDNDAQKGNTELIPKLTVSAGFQNVPVSSVGNCSGHFVLFSQFSYSDCLFPFLLLRADVTNLVWMESRFLIIAQTGLFIFTCIASLYCTHSQHLLYSCVVLWSWANSLCHYSNVVDVQVISKQTLHRFHKNGNDAEP